MKKVKVQNIAEIVNRLAPRQLAEDWDNVGLLVGSFSAQVEKIFVCLDVTDETVKNAVDFGADLIVVHHPIIFRAVKNFRTDLPLGNKLSTLIKNDVSVFAAHTNLDSAEGGVNDVLAEKLGLIDVKTFDEELSLGRIGYLPNKMTAVEFAKHVATSLNVDAVRLIDAGNFEIEKVGICGGAGSEFIGKAKFLGAQAFVTGDVKYHEAQSAFDNKIHVVDAGHFATEFPVVHMLAEKLKVECDKLGYNVEIAEDTTSRDIFKTISR